MRDDTESDYCDRLPGQHLGRLSLELQWRELYEWNLRIEKLELRVRNLQNDLAAMTASPAAGESPGISPDPAQAHGLSEHQLRAIGQAASALRFSASQNDWHTEASANELRRIANTLTGIEIEAAATPSAADDCAETIQTRIGTEWTVRLSQDLLTISDEHGDILHRSRGHVRTGVYLAMLIEKDRHLQATPSASVGASGPGAGDADKLLPCPFCGGKAELIGISTGGPMCWSIHCRRCYIEFTTRYGKFSDAWNRRAVAADTVPRAEYDRVVKLNHHLREVAVMAIVERVPSNSKPTNRYNPESEDTPPRGNDGPATDKPFELEYGKRYLRREGQVSGALVKTINGHECEFSHPFLDVDNGLTYRPDGAYMSADWAHGLDLVSEYNEPEPSPPAESVAAVASTADRLRKFSEQLESGETIKATRIERHETPDGPMYVRTQTDMKPAESPDDWVTQDRFTMRECDQIRWIDVDTDLPCCNPLGEWADVVISRYVFHGFVDCGKYRLEIRCRRKDLPVKAPVTKTPSSIDLNADKPRMRQVTLSEYRHTNDEFAWTSCSGYLPLWTGRTAVVEVPE